MPELFHVFPVRLPPCFYLPRTTSLGFEVRDRLPWEDAVSYVTDGIRFGVQRRDGRVEWLIRPAGASLLASDYRLETERLPAEIRVEDGVREVVQAIWRENAELLGQILPPPRRYGIRPAAVTGA